MATLIKNILVLWAVTFCIYALVYYLPGDAYYVPFETMVHELGAQPSFISSYFYWIKNLALNDWGFSEAYQRPVKELVLPALCNTTSFLCPALLLTYLTSYLLILVRFFIPAFLQNILDRLAFLSLSIPMIWLIYFIFYLSMIFNAPVHPMILEETPMKLYALPLSLFIMSHFGFYYRILKKIYDEEFRKAYVLTGLAKGLPKCRLFICHLFKPILIPFLSVSTLSLGQIITGQFVLENLFSYPGTGHLFIEGILMNDRHLVAICAFWATFLFLSLTVCFDLLKSFFNPRTNFNETST